MKLMQLKFKSPDADLQAQINALKIYVQTIENKSVIIREEHQVYDTPGYINFNHGNIHIDGYYEGQVDGGGW